MNYGFGFRAAPGFRLRATRRGPRVSIGPRIARVHLGGGRPAVSAGRGPFTVWSTLSGGGHDQFDADGAGHGKAKAWHDQRAHLDALLTAHEAPVSRARRPVVPPPEPVDTRAVRRELRRGATADLPLWRVGARLAARRGADGHLDAEVARREQERQREHGAQQAEADRWWQALLDNDAEVVTGQLERAFTDHAMPATPVGLTDDTVHLVIPADTPERLIGKREPTLTEKGNLSLAIMSKTRRHELYVQAIGSATLAVAAETFAVAPAIQRVEVAVVEPGHPSGPAVIALAELERDTVLPDGADRPALDDLVLASEQGHVRLVLERTGQARAPRPLPPEDPSITMILDILDVE